MAYTTIDDSEAYFQVKKYTGDGTGSASGGQAITFDGDTNMQPDIVWVKVMDSESSPMFIDSVNGSDGTSYRAWKPSATSTPTTHAEFLLSIQSDGFTVGSNGKYGADGDPYIAWCWKAGTTSGINSTGADITPSAYSFNQDAGISIIKYTGNGSSGAKIAHGLGAKPACIWVKNTETTENHILFHHKNTLAPETDYLLFNTTAVTVDAARWNDTLPGTVYYETDDNDAANKNTDVIMGYCFAEVPGFSMFGKYVGNADADGVFLYTGFRPAMFIFKETGNAENWMIYDNKRTDQGVKQNPIDQYMFVNTNGVDTSGVAVDFLSNGIKLRANNGHINEGNYVFMAWAESPFVNSSGVPCNAM